MTAAQRISLTEAVGCKASREDLRHPGDFCFATLDGRRTVTIMCPLCGTPAVAERHTIVQDEPLTLSPAMTCPSGCRYEVRDGKVAAA